MARGRPRRRLTHVTRAVELVLLSQRCMHALLDGELDAAGAECGLRLPEFFLGEGWLWRIRVEQIDRDPASAPWLVRAVAAGPERTVVGHAGFHGPPGADGVVEVGYTVVPELRGRGHGAAMLQALVDDARAGGASGVRASISPENAPSLSMVRRVGFRHVGEQWDDEDGQELLFLLDLS